MAYTPLCMHMALLRSLSILLLASMLVSGNRIDLILVDGDGSFTREQIISRTMDDKKSYNAPKYLMEAKIGTAPEPFLAIVDTGSDLVWTRLLSHCNRNVSSSSNFTLVSSSDDMCKPCYPQKKDMCKPCDPGLCIFEKTYGTGKKTAKGFLGSAAMTLSGETTDKNITLGCTIDHDTLIPDYIDGIVGLSRGRSSLWKQMKVTNFSYCLSSQSKPKLTSPLWIGLPAPVPVPDRVAAADMKSTPLVELSSHGYMYENKHNVELSAISIGEKKKELPREKFKFKSKEGEGAMMVDTGTWRTLLEKHVFEELKNLLIANNLELTSKPITRGVLKFICFTEPGNKPPLKLHFKTDAEMLIPWDNYMYLVEPESKFCLTINQTDGISILGNFLQQNIHMQYDLTEGKEKLSFKRVNDCSELRQPYI